MTLLLVVILVALVFEFIILTLPATGLVAYGLTRLFQAIGAIPYPATPA